jgi:transposase
MRTWSEQVDAIRPRAVLTERARAEACRRVGKDAHAVAAVARDLGVSWATIMRAVADHGRPLVDDPMRLDGVATLGLDETCFLKATRLAPTRYVTGLVDLEGGRLLDVVADRTRTAVERWLDARPRGWLTQVGTVALDPWRGYASALVTPLGHARVVVDHFHAIRLANMVVDQVRRRTQQATLGHRGRKQDPLYRIRRLLLVAGEQLTGRGRARLRAGLAAGDPGGEVAAAWQGKELLRAVYAADGMPAARAALERFYRWSDGVEVAELSRLARTVRTWEVEILTFHATNGCSNGPAEAVNLLIKSAWNGRLGSASLVGHPRRTAGGATTGGSRPPWQGSHTGTRSTSGWTCTATPSRSPRCRLTLPRRRWSRSPATRRPCWHSSAALPNPAACGSATRPARPAMSWPGCCTARGSPAR